MPAAVPAFAFKVIPSLSKTTGAIFLYTAITVLLAFKVTLVGLSVPDAPPAHLTKAHPALAEAVNSIVEPSLYPSADPEIRFFETEPNPSFIRVNSNLSFSINVAVTFFALSNVI